MAKGSGKRWRLKVSRRIAFALLGGTILVATGSGAAAYLLGGLPFLGGKAAAYGLDCTLVDKVALAQGDGERWLREYITIANSDPEGRVRTAVRVAADAARSTEYDLVLVVVADAHGPKDRAFMRDSAVGARVLHAADPARVRALARPFQARYVDGRADAGGQFYGKTVEMPPEAVAKLAAAMPDPYGCKDPAAEAAAEKASAHGAGGEGGGHGSAGAKPSHGA